MDKSKKDITGAIFQPLELAEKNAILNALKSTGFNVSRTATILGIGRATLYRKIEKYFNLTATEVREEYFEQF